MSSTFTQTVQRNVKEEREMYLAADLEEMEKLEQAVEQRRPPLQIVWRNVIIYALLHLAALFGLYQFLFVARWLTCLWAFALFIISMIGVTAGPHRLWSHRAYTATTTARTAFMLASTIALQNDVIEWARDHRCHHKWTDTEADPHNVRRGFFYSHIGWLLTRKSKQLKEMGAKIDLSDLCADPVLVFQRNHYYKLVVILCFLIPTAVPVYFWNESGLVSFYVAAIFRLVFSLHYTWLINSAAHIYGYRPYDASISPTENVWTNFPVGEGGHNFHHTFPQDYRASELSLFTNWTRAVLEAMAWCGMVYDMKVASELAIRRQRENKGDSAYH